ncbi:major facilitator superfamily transporter [Immersiella caudata]|uniref:Major facilitator superfamily transporter n=1 Tax=Immersiella caudata TaxID=314043 RepID=A0AA39W4F3_9PEZI|nr:major facilitator superfamily transporter [Immersiella caudata]
MQEKKLLRKADLHLIPLIMLLYCFSFLDSRVNIGNARLYGLEEDLSLTDGQFQMAVSILFVTYVTFEIPSNLVLKKFTPRNWISFLAVSWGILAMCQGFVQNFGELVALRLLLGAFEAGLFPGLTVYLTFFYTKRDLALRIGYLFVPAAVAGAFGGLVAFGIGHMDGVAGYRSWRWVFIIEGLPTVLVGVGVYLLLPNDPSSATWMNDEERKIMIQRRARDYGCTERAQVLEKQDVILAFKDWKAWMFGLGQFGAGIMLYAGYSTFLPTIIQGVGPAWTPEQIQLLTVPCYFIGAATYMVIAAVSDRLQKRGLMCVIFGIVCIAGYAVLLSSSSPGVQYFGCFLVATGLYVAVGLPIAWLPTNCPRYGKRTTAVGIQVTLANLAGIVSPFIYPTDEKPRYTKGNAISLAMVAMSTMVFGFMWFWFARENRRRDASKTMLPEYEGLSDEELAELGDESPRFRYTV